jgi:alkyl sulfatase BDS1-like metallo-beta-lactamase superfamily hydrolase
VPDPVFLSSYFALVAANLLKVIAMWLKKNKKFCVAASLLLSASTLSATEHGHFHPKGKLPTAHTIEKQQQLRASLPLSDKQDFEEQQRGFIARPTYDQIMADAGHVAWDMGKYGYLLEGKDIDSIHPSLQRQATLNTNYGLYEVVPGIYQVRGYDLANITFIQGETGWIIFDTLTTRETARAALQFVNEQLGERPVVAVVYSHSHVDHFGGVRGVVDEADVKSGKVQVIAPSGFMEHAVAENVYAGNAMTRRAFYQYGFVLPRNEYGHVDQAIGKGVAVGAVGLIAPNRTIGKPFEELVVDGVRMQFQNTPGTEAPSEMNTYFPDMKAFWAAENITGTIHNIYTLRGALIRDSLAWSRHINAALYTFGQEAEVMFSSHNWPRWGNARIQEVMRGQRDMYAHMNNQVLHLANKGVTINEIHNEYQVPESQQQEWYARGYHGSFEHNVRGVMNRYLGYWDANPATLIPLSPADAAPLYIEMMGGRDKVLKKGRELYDAGRYMHAQEILNKLVYADPQNQAAKDLLADVFEQIGYQQESPSVRNSYLVGALELRSGVPTQGGVNTLSPDLIKAISTDLFLDFLGIRMDATKADGVAFKINFVTPDNGEKYVLELSNGALTNIPGYMAQDADLTFTINRSELEDVMMQRASFEDKIKAGKATLDGDAKVFQQLKSMLVEFEQGFEIMPGTRSGG